MHARGPAARRPQRRSSPRASQLGSLLARPRHELRRAAQRGHPALHLSTCSSAIGVVIVADHGGRSRSSSWRGWVAGTARAAARRRDAAAASRSRARELQPLARDLRALVRDLESEPPGARREPDRAGTPETLRDDPARGPARATRSWSCPTASRTSTCRERRRVEVQRPASGLVTALEPVMRACSGTWIAHGSGSADRETVDAHDRVARAAATARATAAPRLADAGGGGGLLLRLRQRGAVAAVPHRPHAAGVPRRRLGALRDGQPALRRRRAQEARTETRSCWCRTTTSRCCRA